MTPPDPITPERCPCGHDPGDHSRKGACRMCFRFCAAHDPTPERVTLTEGEMAAELARQGAEVTRLRVENANLSDRLREAKADAKAWEQNYDGMFARWAECDTERLALKERLREAEMHLRIARQDAELGETP